MIQNPPRAVFIGLFLAALAIGALAWPRAMAPARAETPSFLAPGQSPVPPARPERGAAAPARTATQPASVTTASPPAPAPAPDPAARTASTADGAPEAPAAPLAQRPGPPPPRAAGAIGPLRQALAAGDAARARALADAAGPLGVRVAAWQLLRAGESERLADYATFLDGHADWPLTTVIARQAERLLPEAPPQAVREWFAERVPQTAAGALSLIAALDQAGQERAAREQAREAWLGHSLTQAQQEALLARHGNALADLHADRLDEMLWRGAHADAMRLLDRVSPGQAALARARLALQARESGVNALIDAVPAALADDPGLAHDRFVWRMRAGNFDGAAELLAERSRNPQSLGRPEVWAASRERLVRRSNNEGNHRLAYQLAANHGLEDGLRFITLEWLAGHIALRRLDDPARALTHFAALRDRVSSPISLSRGAWWEAMAHDALSQPDRAREALARAAEHQTAFYGQLAAERLGLPLDAALIDPPAYPDWRDTGLARSELLQAAVMLNAAGAWHDARLFVLHLARSTEDEALLGALADFWLARGEPNYAVNIAKIAAQSGVVLARASFPLTGLESMELPAPADLVMAIARRESEFDPAVISHADARGLLQVLPGTGELTARRLGLDFDAARLTTDPAFNALLGAGYLEQMAQQFDGALPLIAAAYNAGPGRPRRWITEFGDPRDPATDPIEWTERIPFAETRNYVQRVLESLVIYRAMLTGDRTIRLGDMLRGRG